MSLLLSPLLVGLSGMFVARVAKARRVWRRHGRFTTFMALPVLGVWYLLLGGLLVGFEAMRPLADRLPGQDGTSWVLTSGFLPVDPSWPITHPVLLFVVLIAFSLFPLWYGIGVTLGFWLFGRSPKQTGILGLLR